MLDVSDLQVSYGMIRAVQDFSIRVDAGESVALIGPNGAGKTSALLAIAGLIRSRGKVTFAGADISNAPPHRIVRSGMVLVPEGRGIIGTLTVEENLEMGAYTRARGWRSELAGIYDRFPVLQERRGQFASVMSGGEQQMLAVARALLAKPRLMLLDEPSMGLAPLMVRRIMDIIGELNRDGTTIVLVEQNAKAALKATNRAYVIESGRVVAEGASSDLARDPKVIGAYLSD